MNLKTLLIAIVAMVCVNAIAADLNGRKLKVSFLGDSYTTFQNYVEPDTNEFWYGPAYKRQNNVTSVDQTWWRILAEKNALEIEKNNSYSGATVSYTGYFGADYTDRSFITRADNLGNPDIILVFGGTNDSWAGVKMGDYKYSDWTKDDLHQFRPAFACLLSRLQKYYPDAIILNINNSELNKNLNASVEEICSHYGVPNLQLNCIDKQEGHPSVSGMQQIADQVWKALAPHIYSRVK